MDAPPESDDPTRPWERITRLLAAHAPDASPFPGPAPDDALGPCEEITGEPLPADYRRWLLECCGGGGGPALGRWELVAPADAVDTARMMQALADDGHADAWEADWLPFASDGAGSVLCLDPTGHVVEVPRAAESWEVADVAPSFTEWLGSVADDLDGGRLVITEDEEGRFTGVRGADVAESLNLLVRGEPDAARARKRAVRPAPSRVAQSLVLHLLRWHLVSPPADFSLLGMHLAFAFSAPPAGEEPVATFRRALAEHGYEIVVDDAELARGWRVLADGRLPRDLPRPPEERADARSFADAAHEALDDGSAPDPFERVDALTDALTADPDAARAWTLPATEPLPDDVVAAVARVLAREYPARAADVLAIARDAFGPPDRKWSGRLPV